MDPLVKCHEHVHSLIFQHLSVPELLECSLVSRKWYKTIGASSQAMSKLWLNVGDRFNEPKKCDLKVFRASERNYQNFKMSEIENGLQIVLFPRREWRGAQIDIQSFTSFKDYVNLLRIFNETIVDLDLFDMDIENVESQPEALSFKKLQKLRIGYVNSAALQPFMRNMKKLERIVLENISDIGKTNDNSRELITKFLQLQPQLTYLSLSSEAFVKSFEDVSVFDFQLKYLLIEYSEKGENDVSRKVLENLENFLMNQKQLKWITLCEWTFSQTISTIFLNKSIQRVSFDYEDLKNFSSMKVNVNQNLKHLDFDCENITLKWIQPILECAPKAEILYVFHVTEELLDYVLTKLKFLKVLRYCSIFDNFKDLLKQKNARNEIDIVEHKFLDLRQMI